MKEKYFTFYIIFQAVCSCAFGQLPDTDIWVFDLKDSAEQLRFSNPVNITDRPGYDNQPAFSADGEYILFSSVREDNQADIYKYDFLTNAIIPFCSTPENEYSPTFMPDGKNISIVRVEKDSTQRLWKFPIKGGTPKCIMERIDSVGYHCWINKDSVALFILTQPFSLQICNIKSQQPKIIADSIGRCIKIKDDGILYYTIKTGDGKNRLCQYLPSGIKTPAINLIMEGEDYAFLNNDIIYSFGSKLFLAKKFFNQNMKEIMDFSYLGITNITRIVIRADGKKIAIVNAK